MDEGKSIARIMHRGSWSSRTGFVLAAIGSAVGLGNVWRFPYITGQYGGGAFVLVYLGCVLVVGIPIMLAELICLFDDNDRVISSLLIQELF